MTRKRTSPPLRTKYISNLGSIKSNPVGSLLLVARCLARFRGIHATMANHYGTGTLRKRGKIWHVAYWVDGVQRQKSSKSSNIQDAKKLRDQILGKKARGEMAQFAAEKITCGELLDDVLRHVEENAKASTAKIWKLVIEANLRPFFGKLKAAKLSTERMREYRVKRKAAERSDATVNRELSILRTAFNVGRKCTPPKVDRMPYFPVVSQTDKARQGFLTDEQYSKLRDALPDYLKPLFVTAYSTGVRLGELLAWRWEQADEFFR